MKRVPPILKMVLVYISFVIAGIMFGMYYEGWSFAVAMLYSFSSLSTGGLVAPSVATSSFSAWFAGFFLLLGIPLHAMVMATAAGSIVTSAARAKALALVADFDGDDMTYLQLITKDTGGKVPFLRSCPSESSVGITVAVSSYPPSLRHCFAVLSFST